MISPPLRPLTPILMEDQLHRSMPGSSYFDIDPRVAGSHFEARFGMDRPDYFTPLSPSVGFYPFGIRPQMNPIPPTSDPEAMTMGPQMYMDETVRRTNLMVQFVNSLIRPGAHYCQVQPKMRDDGKFPPDFRVPRTVDEVKAMNSSSVDRVLKAYNLPTDLRSLNGSPEPVRPRSALQAKLCTLFDFLGASQVIEKQWTKKNGPVPF